VLQKTRRRSTEGGNAHLEKTSGCYK
jgi:hypothetical protein